MQYTRNTIGVSRLQRCAMNVTKTSQSSLPRCDIFYLCDILPPEDWKRAPGRPRITWMTTVLNDLESHNLTLTEAVSYGSESPVLEVAGREWPYALIVVQTII